MERRILTLLLVAVCAIAGAQARTVKGTVVDQVNEPVIGATINVLGTTLSGVTDFDGTFEIANVPDGATLKFTYIGMQAVEMTASDNMMVQMVDDVRIAGTTFAPAPLRFEAGTPNYVGAIGLSAAISYLEDLGLSDVRAREAQLMRYAEERLNSVSGLMVLGNPRQRAGCLSFSIEGIHPFDLATMVDKLGVALRSGNQCAQPLLYEAYDVERITRLSPAFYNTVDEIDYAVDSIARVVELLQSRSAS